jgi:hypothetical protein
LFEDARDPCEGEAHVAPEHDHRRLGRLCRRRSGGFAAAAALPLAVRAQSGDALAQAENICLENGVAPNAVAFDTCVGRAARAYDRGEPARAALEARRVSDARETCVSLGVEPMTLGYRECMANETNRVALSRYEAR